MTIIVDDAGSGDLLYGVIIAAFRNSTKEFKYGVIDVKYFQPKFFSRKAYLKQCYKIVSKLLTEMKPKPDEEIHICRGYIFDESIDKLKKKYGEDKVLRVKVTGEAQEFVEIAYVDELRNLGYEPIEDRENRRAKSFFHMMRWLKANPAMLCYAKTGWPRLARYRLFKEFHAENLYTAVCSNCGCACEVPFKPDPDRPVYCKKCWAKRRKSRKRASRV